MDLKTRIAFFPSRLAALLSLCLITPLGFSLWFFYVGPYRAWIRFYVTGIVYEIFWSLLAFLCWPARKNIGKIVAVVFLITCLLEFLQLWKPALLQQFRATDLGTILIGTSFQWGQFPYYVIGSLIAWLWLYLLCEKTQPG
jgi:hypothetical protein